MSLLAEVHASLAVQGDDTAETLCLGRPFSGSLLFGWSGSSFPPILKPTGWQDRNHNLGQIKPAVT